MTDYDAAVAFLDARIGLGVDPGLERIAALLDTMADPHLVVPTIHVAGTNGKTSTVRYIAGILSAAGLTTGAFISPHLEAIEQRYEIDGLSLSGAEFAGLVTEVAPIIGLFEEMHGSGVTYFEVTAALAFSLFATYPVGVAVVEVGLGGRLDATNVVRPDVAVITSIGRDHMGYLGDTIGEIATEKAAIIKEGSVAITGRLPDEAEDVVAARVDEVGARRFLIDTDFSVTGAGAAVGGWEVDIEGVYGSYPEIRLQSHGRHQVDNLAVAIASAEAFAGRELDADGVATAAQAATPGRMEVLDTAPLVMIDGAHNAPAAEALAAALEREFPSTTWALVFGAMTDKEIGAMLRALAPFADAVYAVAADSPRAAAPGDLVEMAAEHGLEGRPFASVAEGVAAAVADAGELGAVLVTGSLYVAGEARLALGDGR